MVHHWKRFLSKLSSSAQNSTNTCADADRSLRVFLSSEQPCCSIIWKLTHSNVCFLKKAIQLFGAILDGSTASNKIGITLIGRQFSFNELHSGMICWLNRSDGTRSSARLPKKSLGKAEIFRYTSFRYGLFIPNLISTRLMSASAQQRVFFNWDYIYSLQELVRELSCSKLGERPPWCDKQ